MIKLISVILPTYNEAGNIVRLVEAIETSGDLRRYHKEYLIIDDSSPDGTAAAARKLAQVRPAVHLTVRRGPHDLAGAIAVGIRQARGNIIVLMDTDFNHRPEDISRLLVPILKNKADLAIGSRYIPGGGMHLTEASRWQYWLSRWGNYFINQWLLKLPLHESLSGFVVVKKAVLDQLSLTKIFYGYGEYCIRLLYFSHRLGFRLAEVPVMYGRRQYGVSKSSVKRMTYFYLKTVWELLFTGL